MGRVAAMFSAHSTAVAAAIRRLSEAAHNHKPWGRLVSGWIDTSTSPCPAAFTLLGDSSARPVMVTCSPASALETAIDLDRLFHFDMQGQCVSVKDGGLQQQQREQGRVLAGDPLIMLEHTVFYSIQRRDRLLAIARHHVEGHLGIEHFFRQLLEGEQVDSLLMELVHALLPMLRRRLEDRGHNPFHCPGFLQPQQQKRQHYRSRMGHHCRPGLQFRSEQLAQLTLDPRRLHLGIGFILQSVGEIDDGAARGVGFFPVLPGAFLVGGEKSEIDFFKLFRAHALDERHLVTHRLQLSQRIVIVQQLDVERRKIAVAQDLGDLFPLERARAHDGQPVKARRPHRLRVRNRHGFEIRAHEVCGASV